MRGRAWSQADRAEEVLFELRRVGAAVRVSAVHVGANVEVSVMGPLSAGEAALKRAALQKLIWVMSRGESAAAPARRSRGLLA